MRTLETRTKTISDDLVEQTHGLGYHLIFRGSALVCDDSDDTFARAAKFAIQAGNLRQKTVAWIGGGFGIGPRVFDVSNCTQTIYEIEPALSEFCPINVTFVPGDWKATLSGLFDIIVFDLGTPTPEDILLLDAHLELNGRLLEL
jgi:hypothetical protein